MALVAGKDSAGASVFIQLDSLVDSALQTTPVHETAIGHSAGRHTFRLHTHKYLHEKLTHA